jgi:hypothetical protein
VAPNDGLSASPVALTPSSAMRATKSARLRISIIDRVALLNPLHRSQIPCPRSPPSERTMPALRYRKMGKPPDEIKRDGRGS